MRPLFDCVLLLRFKGESYIRLIWELFYGFFLFAFLYFCALCIHFLSFFLVALLDSFFYFSWLLRSLFLFLSFLHKLDWCKPPPPILGDIFAFAFGNFFLPSSSFVCFTPRSVLSFYSLLWFCSFFFFCLQTFTLVSHLFCIFLTVLDKFLVGFFLLSPSLKV